MNHQLLDQIDALKAQVAALPSEQFSRDEVLQDAIKRAELAKAEAARAMAALAALQKKHDETLAAIQWTMKGLQIRDLLGGNRESVEIPAAAEGWLPLDYCPEDTKRLEWINKHGRAGVTMSGFSVQLPVDISGDETIPGIYNIRHIIDIARKFKG